MRSRLFRPYVSSSQLRTLKPCKLGDACGVSPIFACVSRCHACAVGGASAERDAGTLQQPHNLRRRPLAAPSCRDTAFIQPRCNGANDPTDEHGAHCARNATSCAKKPSSFCSFPDRVSTQSSLNLSECLGIIVLKKLMGVRDARSSAIGNDGT